MGKKFKPHKGLGKRVRITRNGQVRHTRAGLRHRKSRHTTKQNRQLRLPKLAAEVERRRCQSMLGFKIRRPEQHGQQQQSGADGSAESSSNG